MENDSHLPIPALHDAAGKKIILSPEQWNHLHNCELCLIYLASLVDVHASIEQIRNKLAAA